MKKVEFPSTHLLHCKEVLKWVFVTCFFFSFTAINPIFSQCENDPPVLNCPPGLGYALSAGQCDAWVEFNITAADGCGNSLNSITQTDDSGLSSGDHFPIGQTTLSYEVIDANGITATCSFVVDVHEFEANSDALACNDQVNVSLDANCEAIITPDMILEGSYGCSDDFVVALFEGDHETGTPIATSPLVTSEYVDQLLTVTITNSETGIMCWGTVLIENKNNPILECPPAAEVYCTGSDVPVFPDDYPTVEVSCCAISADSYEYTDGPAGGMSVSGFEGAFAPANWVQIQQGDGSIVFATDGSEVTITGDNSGSGQLVNELQYAFPIAGTVSFDYSTFNFDYPGYDFFYGLLVDGEMVEVGIVESESTSGSASLDVEANQLLVFGVITDDGLFGALEATVSNFSFALAADTPMNDDCEGAFLRTWVFQGCNGQAATCEQLIIRTRPSVDDVEFPDDVELECGSAYDPDALDGIITIGTNDEDYPNVDGFDIAPLNCNLGATYEDQRVDVCLGSFKILRTWTVIDWCTGLTRIEEQIIKVLDTEAPIIECPDHITTSVDPNECLAYIVLPEPVLVDDECAPDGVTIEVSSPAGVVSQLSNGTWILSELPKGDYSITYKATDDCGNSSECSFFIWNKDLVPPIAVCDEFTSISLGANGTAREYADGFDDGSHDNCNPVYFKVRRMQIGECNQLNGDDNPNNNPYDEWFDDYVDFCCEDIENGPIFVIMRVYDVDPGEGPIVDNRHDEGGSLYGRYNDCMVQVEVEDKLDPFLICPPDITISCDFDYSDLTVFGEVVTNSADRNEVILDDPGRPNSPSNPYYLPQPYNWGLEGYAGDNCSVVITESSSVEVDCGHGQIIRSFTATDPQGRTATCVQTITVQNFEPFDENDISWPSDRDANCTQGLDTDATGEPSVNTDDCDNVFVGYDDLVLPFAPPHCFKIIRTWTVVDWCQYDPSDPNTTGRWEHEQIIKVTDSDGPTITAPADITIASTEDNCSSGPVTLDLAIASDNCDSEVTITNNFNNGGADASDTYFYGTTTVIFTATDACGNVSTDEMTVTVIDGKEPTPVCQFIATTVMPSSGTVEIWANDFEADGSSFDNCTAFEDLEFRIRKTAQLDPPNNTVPADTETSVTFDCTELGQQWVDVWVIDEAGNADHCRTYVVIQDPTGACIDDPTLLMANLAGRIANEADEDVEEVTIDVAGAYDFPAFVTALSGNYEFSEVPMHNNYSVTPSKNMNPLNGVSTLDIVLITKHILGVESLPTPYKIIAADVNGSNSVTTIDVVELRKLILHIDTDFQNNQSWRFVDKSFVFPNPTAPFATTFPEIISINDLGQDEMALDFVGIKVGDVNGSAIPNSLVGTEDRNKVGELLFNVNDMALEAGQTYTVNFDTKQDVLGYQFTLAFDQEALSFVDITSGDAANFGLSLLEKGVITTSWDNNAKSPSFALTFKATTSTQLSKVLNINSNYTKAEAYTNNADLLDVAIAFNTVNGTVVAGGEFELYQNRPNPVKGETLIGFTLPEASNATLSIYDVRGKLIKQFSGDFHKGYNEISINSDALNSTGLLYYQLDTDNNTATKKMIILD